MKKNELPLFVNEIISAGMEVCDSDIRRKVKPLLPKVVFMGTESVGKSSLFKTIVGTQDLNMIHVPELEEPLVETNWVDTILFIDSPSFLGEINSFQFELIRQCDLVIHVCDIDVIRRNDLVFSKLLSEIGIAHITVLNKIDRILTTEKRTIKGQYVEKKFNKKTLMVSALTGENISTLIDYICHDLVARKQQYEVLETVLRNSQLTSNLNIDKTHRKKSEEIIKTNIQDAVILGVSGELKDLLNLVFLHSKMIKSIAAVYNEDSPPDLLEGKIPFILRSSIQAISKFIPIVGPNIGAATAILWTQSIGKMAIEYFEKNSTEN